MLFLRSVQLKLVGSKTQKIGFIADGFVISKHCTRVLNPRFAEQNRLPVVYYMCLNFYG